LFFRGNASRSYMPRPAEIATTGPAVQLMSYYL
jgi:hypothetical protein